ncbi:hypothetical protein EDB82DRAFT_572905 [Fusarium venenatum]|uniref:uncharacterized protein n=1 Tax=Fusarium venenatum TaxID=56646 RepID=UPI001D840B33|nr:hypothetical protein EDB82DRAFT_572905 [Fusarium venenatum]
MISSRQLAAVLFLAGPSLADNFTISNGQIFTPGFVVLDAPQPYTPLGGDGFSTDTSEQDTLHVAIDVTANGKLPLPSNDDDSNDDNQIFSIEMFLYSYVTGRNFTISNGTASANNASLGEIMAQEPGSTVKHVNWVWPDCLVGDGAPEGESDRGVYNVRTTLRWYQFKATWCRPNMRQISIRQNFRFNGDDYYTIFDVPISVNNSIPEDNDRPSCDELSNELLSPEDVDVEAANEVGVLFAPGDATELDISGEESVGSVLGPNMVYVGVMGAFIVMLM